MVRFMKLGETYFFLPDIPEILAKERVIGNEAVKPLREWVIYWPSLKGLF